MSSPFRRILGLDVGSKGIGVAVSDPLGITAQGLTLLPRRDPQRDLAELRKLVDQYDVGEIAVGLPRNMDGSIGFQAQAVQEFVAQLQQAIPVEVALVDERLTTVEATRRLQEMNVRREKRKQIIDQQAAVIILQTYLQQRENRQRRRAPPDAPQV